MTVEGLRAYVIERCGVYLNDVFIVEDTRACTVHVVISPKHEDEAEGAVVLVAHRLEYIRPCGILYSVLLPHQVTQVLEAASARAYRRGHADGQDEVLDALPRFLRPLVRWLWLRR